MSDQENFDRMILLVVLIIAAVFPIIAAVKIPNHNSILTGALLYKELMETESVARFRTYARMDKPTFLCLLELLVIDGGLKDNFGVPAICSGQKLIKLYILFLPFTKMSLKLLDSDKSWHKFFTFQTHYCVNLLPFT